MRSFVPKGIMARLALYFIVISVVPVMVVGYFAFDAAKDALKRAQYEKLHTERELRERDVAQYIRETFTKLTFLAKMPSVKSAFEKLSDYQRALKDASDVDADIDSIERITIAAQVDRLFRIWQEVFESGSSYSDIFILGKNGVVIHSQKQRSDLGANLVDGALKDSGLARLRKKVTETKKPALTDFSYYEPAGAATAFIGVPVFDDYENLTGVLALALGPKQVNDIFELTGSLGRTGDVYLVGEDFLMRSDSRREEASTMLKTRVETKAAREALANKEGTDMIEGRKGEKVLSSYAPVRLGRLENLETGFDWAIIAEMSRDEAFQPIATLKQRVIITVLVVALVAFLTAFLLARGLVRPLEKIKTMLKVVSTGDISIEVPVVKGNDELASLAGAFGMLVDTLRRHGRGLIEGVNVLGSSVAEISATASQLSASTSRTSVAVTETTTTVAQVKHAAEVSSEKAKNVAAISRQAVPVSESGRKAVEDTMNGMLEIKRQMESIRETVVRLNDRSHAIEEIITAVQDLADQSNLLAVNASIEAARAGEHGRGFSVVAHEIKTLSDQSKEATRQVSTILGEIRKWVAAVVTAAEQGTQAVETGVRQSETAGEAIRALEQSVHQSSQAASIIDSSTEQQFVGVDQVATAMENIERAMAQNLESSAQLEAEAKTLEELGNRLKEMVDRYKL